MATAPADEDEFTELVDFTPSRVDAVGKGANGVPRFLIAKQDDGARGLVPPELVRDLIGKQADPTPTHEEQVTMTGTPTAIAQVTKLIHEAAQSARASRADSVSKDTGPELDDSAGCMDPVVPLAEPDEMAPGDPAEPGSPAWESIDAATAQKWTSIAVRLKNALDVMAERELIEAASADPDDIDAAWDLQDAMCAVDFVIDTLASFAVGEQAEADLAGEAMEAIGKALAGFDPAPLDALEGLAAVAKAGRVLSSANEARIRSAAGELQQVLASLPNAPQTTDGGQVVAKEGDTHMDDTTPAEVEKTAEPDAPEAVGVEKTAEPDAPAVPEAAAGDGQVAKADDGEPDPKMQAVFDANGKLVGVVDPSAITPVAGAVAPAPDAAPAADADPAAAPAADAGDMTPAPAPDAGTPADADVDDDGTVAKQDPNGDITISQDVLKGIVTEAVQALLDARTPAEDIAKQADVAGLLGEVETLKARLATVEEQPAAPKVFHNGQTPQQPVLRGQDQGGGDPSRIDVGKALERKHELYTAPDATEQNRIATEMQGDAIAALAAIHNARR